MSVIVKEALEGLIREVKNDPTKAQAVFETTSVLGEHVSVTSSSRQFDYQFDEPEIFGGQDGAPNPVEYVLGALGACQAIMYRALSSLKGIHLDKVTVKTKGYLDAQGFTGLNQNVRPGYQKIEYETIIESGEHKEKLERLAEQVDLLCPVLDIISNPVEVKGSVTIQHKPELVRQ